MSHPPQLQHNGYAGKETHGDDKRPESARNGDLEKLETTHEGEVLAQNADAAKREWIKTAPQSPRNWPLWRKCKLLHSSILGFGASFSLRNMPEDNLPATRTFPSPRVSTDSRSSTGVEVVMDKLRELGASPEISLTPST